MNLIIKKIEKPDSELVKLQCEVWQLGELDALPIHLLTIINKMGGLLLGAYLNGKLLGFACSLLSNDGKDNFHHLHMLGALPGTKNVGFELMEKHKKWSREMGIEKIEWTFDPLEPANANLYLKKLRGTVKYPFLPNYYGVENGLASDRVLVTLNLEDSVKPTPIYTGTSEKVDLENYKQLSGRIRYQISPIPFTKLIENDFEAARTLRVESGQILGYLLANDWQIIGFHSNYPNGSDNYLVLEKS